MSTTITFTRHKRLNASLKDESNLLLQLEELARVEPVDSIFYIEPSFNTTYGNVMQVVNTSNNRQRKGMMCKSTFKVESEIGKSIKVLKVRNEKADELLCEFTFHKSPPETATSGEGQNTKGVKA